jgi:deoxyribodipyrimidine photo-lyase
LLSGLKRADDLPELAWITPGEDAARLALERFVDTKLADYDSARNDPTRDGQSNLSPYLHFGQLAPQRTAWEIDQAQVSPDARGAFLEELFVRRELSDNHCWYNQAYGSFHGLPAWAQRTLDAHRADPRDFFYTYAEFEQAETHDPLWNAAQRALLRTGKMHGYMRMYWAKKVLEWSPAPEDALRDVIRLNDTYSLDGRDPNGYVGAAWSVGGLHDRPWANRPVFGQIRYMNFKGCRRKFDVDAYIKIQG